MKATEWIYCPICGNKTRTMIREDTELRNFPLYCPKCKKETSINAQDMKVTLAEHKQDFYVCRRMGDTIAAVFRAYRLSLSKDFFLCLGWFLCLPSA